MTKSSSFFLELLAKGVKDLSAEFESNLTQQCELELAAEERVNGKLTQAARDARQALNNPNLMTTHHARHLTAARKTMLSAKKAEASALSQAVVAMINAAQATDYLQECEKASAKIEPRKRPTPAVGVDPEEMVLINELRKRGVTASKCDQLNDENLDYLANLINDKVKAPRHADIGDSWGRAFSAGHLEIPVECASADQKLAMNIAMNPDRQDAAITYDDLCRLAKKKLDISHDFALNLCKELNEREWFNGAYAENIVRAFHEQRDKDIDITLEVLGISPESYKRANQVVDSKYSNLLFSRFHARKIADEQQSNNMKKITSRSVV